jgi:hypothetical protein
MYSSKCNRVLVRRFFGTNSIKSWNAASKIKFLISGANSIKGTVSRDFLLLVFFMNQFPPNPRVSHKDRFKFLRKFAEIFASQGLPPVSKTPVANLPPMSTTPATICRRYQRHRWQICHWYQRHRRQILPPVSLVLLTYRDL